MKTQTLQRNIFQRLLGLCATKAPADDGSWTVRGNQVLVDLGRVPELADPNRAVRLEKKGLPERLLVFHGNDGRYHVFKNRCKHGGRRVDPVPGREQVQCCSLGRSTYDYSGKILAGPAKRPLETLPVRMEDDRLVIEI